MSKTCLVVDDSKIVRKVVRKIVETLGFAVLEAEDGQQAVEQVRFNKVDVIILDWNMPVMDGLTCMQTIRGDANIDPQPIIIFCTTENEFSKIQQAVMAGANEYVMKPFDEAIIAGKLRQLGLLPEA
jgi:two-component system chemotaxis response regulator CheY